MIQRLLTLICALLLYLMSGLSFAETERKAPSCALTSMDTLQRYDLQKFQGKVVYVDFWASWCPPCVKSFPFLNDLEHDFKDQGLQVIAINLDEALQDAKDFLAKQPANFTLALDTSKQCAQAFGVMAMPSSYLIDRKGIIRHTSLGFRPETAKALRTLTQQLLKESGEQK
ncbi:MAG: TlpA family protein disulfide reductase [Methylococcaceae bacterium]|nr:TlpA family protein disulfide reductase [Methylococcaceae bacterium]